MVTLTLGDGTSTAVPVRRTADWWVEVLDAPDACLPHLAAWDDLAWNAVDPNPFYASWMLLPAWKRYPEPTVQVALVFRTGARPQDPPELCGLFPLIKERVGSLPVELWSLWHHPFCCLCTPLVRQGVAQATLRTLWDWMESQERGPVAWRLPHLAGDGLFQQAFIDVANERSLRPVLVHQYNRALIKPIEDAAAYCAATMTCHNRQEMRRQRRRLGERGQVEIRTSQPGDEINSWIDQFLAVEASGWKGNGQTALAAKEQDAAYFREIVQGAAVRNEVVFLGIYLDGQPIALKVNFLSGQGSFAFKIAFDESFAKFSPGVQLELENIDWVHRQRGLSWMDSCAKPEHFMIGRLWRERRSIQHLLVSTGSRWGDLLISAWPLMNALRSFVKGRPKFVTAQTARAQTANTTSAGGSKE